MEEKRKRKLATFLITGTSVALGAAAWGLEHSKCNRLEKEVAAKEGENKALEAENRKLSKENNNLNYQLGKMVARR